MACGDVLRKGDVYNHVCSGRMRYHSLGIINICHAGTEQVRANGSNALMMPDAMDEPGVQGSKVLLLREDGDLARELFQQVHDVTNDTAWNNGLKILEPRSP